MKYNSLYAQAMAKDLQAVLDKNKTRSLEDPMELIHLLDTIKRVFINADSAFVIQFLTDEAITDDGKEDVFANIVSEKEIIAPIFYDLWNKRDQFSIRIQSDLKWFASAYNYPMD